MTRKNAVLYLRKLTQCIRDSIHDAALLLYPLSYFAVFSDNLRWKQLADK